MADVLSQQEIDALLSALNNGEIQASDVKEQNDKVKVYDFKRAMRYSKEHLRSITRIHENFSRLLTSFLSTQLRTFVQIEIDLVDQVNYSEFVASIPSKTILNVFDVKPVDGKMVMEINPQVAYAVLERLLGGQGDASERNGSLTEIETVLLQKVFTRAFEMYQEVWKDIENMRVKLEGIETNPQFIQIASQNDTVIIIVFHTTIGETTGRMTLCIPHLIVEPVLPKLSTHQWLSSLAKKNVPQQDKIIQNLDNVRVPVLAELGRATLPVSEIMNLQIGDVIGIETGKIQVKVGQQTRFLGNPGTKKGRYAIQIDQVIQVEGDDLKNE
ncbi:flagellar motor switch protein FliM [Bacillus sp. BRMEA1]|uniref:flagellar motor switch protein FliM n=1 Tax=Neobacillus endophyticus TaxID=2738405 RepID=UPI0015661849|nr:flagellar motor switch protein FliM [Neobacillus endophyticus]NRD79365.1 flagellar motor switch protein FliM [Neobacillus endophyticus]